MSDADTDAPDREEASAGLVRRLEEERLALEREVVRRGVKLSCANIALARAKIAFDQAAQRREELVADVSHDLRTPLTSIKGAAQNLLDGIAGPLTTEQREYVEIVRAHAERLITIANGLVEAMRASAVPIELAAEPIDVGALAAEVARSLGPLAAARGVALETSCEPIEVVADGAKIRQVLENLIGNALKYTERGGTVRVEAAADGRGARVEVRDTGCGIPADQWERIFDRFWKGSSERAGAGLGLAIARDVVRQHGGDLVVDSRAGAGSTFTMTLPRG